MSNFQPLITVYLLLMPPVPSSNAVNNIKGRSSLCGICRMHLSGIAELLKNVPFVHSLNLTSTHPQHFKFLQKLL